MSRWNTLPGSASSNPTFYPQNSPASASDMSNGGAPVSTITGANPNEVYQHGTIGKFIRSEMEGTQSGYLKCIYEAKYTANNTVTLMCEKRQLCCTDGCCPKDQYWMAAVYILLTFVLLVFIGGTCLMIICYQRSKSKQRRAEREAMEYANYNGGSQVDIPPTTGAYSSYGGPHY